MIMDTTKPDAIEKDEALVKSPKSREQDLLAIIASKDKRIEHMKELIDRAQKSTYSRLHVEWFLTNNHGSPLNKSSKFEQQTYLLYWMP